jgi:fucose 4-O-acetylase-like acetyltransferase
MKERIAYLDIARGLAMLLVIFYHVPLYIRICHPQAAELLAPHIHAGTYILPFFMPVFFVISGYFTNTDKPYGQFLWGDVKHLLLTSLALQLVNVLIQAIGLGTIGPVKWFFTTLFSRHCLDILFSQWFISAIFFARQIYYALNHLSAFIIKTIHHSINPSIHHSIILSIFFSIPLAIAGILLEPYAPFNDKWFYIQGLVFVIFIPFGRLLSSLKHSINPSLKHFIIPLLTYPFLLLLARFFNLSTLEYGMVNISFTVSHWPFYMLLALSGSVFLISLARLLLSIHHSIISSFTFIGRHTLVFYIPQGGTLYVAATLLGRLFLPDTPLRVWLFILILWAVTLLVLSLLSLAYDAIQNRLIHLRGIYTKYI